MAPLPPMFAVLVACAARGIIAHQQLVFFAPRDWDKVKRLQLRVDRHDSTGWSPNEDGWFDADAKSSPIVKTFFAYKLLVKVHDKVSVKLTMIDDETPREDSMTIADVRSSGKTGISKTWTVGSVSLFSQLENVRHEDVWHTFITKLLDARGEDLPQQMDRLFKEADDEHQGWHVLLMMDHIPTGKVELSYTTSDKKQKTEKLVQDGDVFGAWTIDDVPGELELAFSVGPKVTLQIETATFASKPWGEGARVYILPFKSHQEMDAAWRQVHDHHLSEKGEHPFYDVQARAWKGEALEALTEGASSPAAAPVAASPASDRATASEHAPDEDATVGDFGFVKLAIVSVFVAALLVAGCYYVYVVSGEDDLHCSAKTGQSSHDTPEAPSGMGDAWPMESVVELTPPKKEVEVW